MTHPQTPPALPQVHILRIEKGWLAVDKPCGMSVHNDPGQDLVSFLTQRIGADSLLMDRLGISSSFKVQPVHRLDRETGGVILLSVNDKALRDISTLFVNGQVKKRYMALVHGNFISTDESHGYQVWDYPLSKTAGGRNNPAGEGKRVPCRTRYKILQQSPHYALLEIEPVTGRKHQIRRHAKLSGHPVTGDTRYGSARSIEYLWAQKSYACLGLHCRQIEFTLPEQETSFCIQSKNPLTEIFQLMKGDGPIS
jgi:23S rRNA-/tRNA-specific pseudouridylate synthase